MMVMEEKKLVEMVLEADLLPTRVREIRINHNMVMLGETEERFLEFVKRTGTRYVFYLYTYYDLERYLIPDEWYSDYAKSFKTIVHDHNQSLRALDFSVPYKLSLFMLLDGTYVGVEYEAAWLTALGFDEAEREFEKIEDSFYHELL